jgi:hypothetical protein
MTEKVLLLHGPIESTGINFFTAEVYRSPEQRCLVSAKYHAGENIRAISHIFRSHGYKVVYSAWEDDQDWIVSNKNLFDAYTINPQERIPSSCDFQGRLIPNNKEKLYRSIYYGIQTAEENFTSECTLIRLRSDVAVDVKFIEHAVHVSNQYTSSILIEYADKENILFVPDFITVSSLSLLKNLYENLILLCEKGESYHISSHIDHGIEILNLKEKGLLSNLICMDRAVYDSMVWRGIPKYFANIGKDASQNLLFNCLVKHPEHYTVANVLPTIPQELSGRGRVQTTRDLVHEATLAKQSK